jgi:hypothetical protein
MKRRLKAYHRYRRPKAAIILERKLEAARKIILERKLAAARKTNTTKQRAESKKRRCSRCGEVGHNVRTCKDERQ